MNDMELLKSAQLYQTDHETGKSGVTLAGILLLGQDNLILSVLPFHKTDLILPVLTLTAMMTATSLTPICSTVMTAFWPSSASICQTLFI